MKHLLLLLLALIWSTGCGTAQSAVANGPVPNPLEQRRLDHIIIIFPENHTFDLLFGKFPRANGLDSPGGIVPQVDQSGNVLATLPPVPGSKLPANLPNAPFLINPFYSETDIYPSPVHRFYQNLMQLNGDPLGEGRFGNFRMNMFVSAVGDEGTLAMGYYDTERLPLYPYAREFVLMDNFFGSQFGGSMLGHFWLIAARTPVWPNAAASLVLQPVFDAAGRLVGLNNPNGVVTPDGFAVEDAQPFYPPFAAGTPDDQRVPPQTNLTIGDLLNQKGVTWAWYSQGWNDAAAGNPSPDFIYHHQPFVYFEAYKPGTTLRANHLKDVEDFRKALRDGTLPAVSFIKPMAGFDEHSGQSPIYGSEEYTVGLIEEVRNSPYWDSAAIFVTYDDFGGFYDHVPPVMEDRWGPGNRVPCLLISPLARRGYVDHTLYNTQSILRLIEDRFGLPALSERDRRATSVIGAFDLERFPNLLGP
jgi:phospholipase C